MSQGRGAANGETVARQISLFPIIPSIKIVDLAKAMAPKLKHKFIGIRPGEKVHELLSSKDEAMNVIKFKNHYCNCLSNNYFYRPTFFVICCRYP